WSDWRGLPRDRPVMLQLGSFDRSHDPLGGIYAYRLVRKRNDVRLVFAGPAPGSGGDVLAEVEEAASQDPDVLVILLPPDPQTEMNALERAATIVIYKPLSTGFGINVATAMWKGKPVGGGLAGGCRTQI